MEYLIGGQGSLVGRTWGKIQVLVTKEAQGAYVHGGVFSQMGEHRAVNGKDDLDGIGIFRNANAAHIADVDSIHSDRSSDFQPLRMVDEGTQLGLAIDEVESVAHVHDRDDHHHEGDGDHEADFQFGPFQLAMAGHRLSS
jgi:hypothetical protein